MGCTNLVRVLLIVEFRMTQNRGLIPRHGRGHTKIIEKNNSKEISKVNEVRHSWLSDPSSIKNKVSQGHESERCMGWTVGPCTGGSLGQHGRAHIVRFIDEDAQGKEAVQALLHNPRVRLCKGSKRLTESLLCRVWHACQCHSLWKATVCYCIENC